MMIPSPPFDTAVVGAGPAGLAATLALRQAGLHAVCIGPPPNTGSPDRRTTALLEGSRQFLDRNIGVWQQLAPHASPLQSLRLIDRTGRYFRAPDMLFQASEIEEEAFGYNIPNADLSRILLDGLGGAFLPSAGVTALQLDDSSIALSLDDGRMFRAKLVVGADGRNSFCRNSANIGTRNWSYDQTATVCNFRHSRPHNGACTEFHYAGGPFTVVPLPGNASSLVLVENQCMAERFAELDDSAFAGEISARLDGLLGEITEVGPRGAFPLSGLTAKRLTGERIALVGEAGHVIPPIGAQGLNLGFRDVADLVKCVAGQTDPGSHRPLAEYERRRRSDVWIRTLTADLLSRTLTSNVPLFQLARGAGLAALSLIGPLRRAAMRQGMSVNAS